MTTSNLASLQKKRKELKGELVQIEKQIYDLETTYLEETRDFGNIFTGWDMYGADGQKTKSKKAIQNDERHFSLSSVTSPASRKEENKKVGVSSENLITLKVVIYYFPYFSHQKRPDTSDGTKKYKKIKGDAVETHADDNAEAAE
eukprot:gene34119-41293_t